jgi:hypothetical protein
MKVRGGAIGGGFGGGGEPNFSVVYSKEIEIQLKLGRHLF